MIKNLVIIALLLSALSSKTWAQEQILIRTLPNLPVAMSNNATAIIHSDNATILFSFKGLGKGKRWQDTSLDSFALTLGNDNSWRRIAPVPGDVGELAATAITLGDKVYVFGGYTVAEDHAEISVARSYEYTQETNEYTLIPEIPVAVDDSVSFTVADRYIYLISGWHNSGNVNLSQVYDTIEKRWFQATPYPGTPVFGHAGAAAGDRFVVCDGVEKIVPIEGRHKYQAVNSCFKGEVDPIRPHVIKWRRIKPHPGKPLYRMAAGGFKGHRDWIVFVGGSDNPYNYDGIGYDTVPSEPSALVMAFSLDDSKWYNVGILEQASMDHRGLLTSGSQFFIVGGMTTGQEVTNNVIEFCLSDQNGKLSPC